jgi:hypothetical protein
MENWMADDARVLSCCDNIYDRDRSAAESEDFSIGSKQEANDLLGLMKSSFTILFLSASLFTY